MSHKKGKILSVFSLIVLAINSTLPVVATTIDLTETRATEKNKGVETTQSSNVIGNEVSSENSLTTTEETSLTSDSSNTQDSTEETTSQESSNSESESEVEETSESTSEDTTTTTTETTDSSTTTESTSTSETTSSSHSQQTSEIQSSSEEQLTDTSKAPVIDQSEISNYSDFIPNEFVESDNEKIDSSISDFHGFEAPLIDSYDDEWSAAIVSFVLQLLHEPVKEKQKSKETESRLENKKEDKVLNNVELPQAIYQRIFDIDLGENAKEIIKNLNEISAKEGKPGNLVAWKTKNTYKLGILLSENKVVIADDFLEILKEDSEDKSVKGINKNNTQEKRERISGIQIFSILPDTKKDDATLFETYHYVPEPDLYLEWNQKMSLTKEGKNLLKNYPVSYKFVENDHTKRFIEQIGDSARELGLKNDLFASVMIAQAILESGSGSSGLSTAPYYNLFGIKGAGVTLPTLEDNGKGSMYSIQAAFRIYPSYKESLEDYTQLIKKGIAGNSDFYNPVWRSEAKNYIEATQQLTGKYATDTQYNNKLNSLIAVYGLTRFDEPKVSKATSNLADIPKFYQEKIKYPVFNNANYNISGSYGSDQCTWFAYNRVHQLGGYVGDYMGNGADWGTTGKRQGYEVSHEPKAGTVISFKQGVAGYHDLYGHVAFVEVVGPDGILISEGDASYLAYRVIPNEIAQSVNVSYVTPK